MHRLQRERGGRLNRRERGCRFFSDHETFEAMHHTQESRVDTKDADKKLFDLPHLVVHLWGDNQYLASGNCTVTCLFPGEGRHIRMAPCVRPKFVALGEKGLHVLKHGLEVGKSFGGGRNEPECETHHRRSPNSCR